MLNNNFNLSEYENWSGDFNQLVEVVNKILNECGYDFEITARTARHYQQKNILGRGLKNGRSSTFDINNIKELLYAKEMIKEGLPIKYTANLINDSQIYNSKNNLTNNSVNRSINSIVGLPLSANTQCFNIGGKPVEFKDSDYVSNSFNAEDTVSKLLSMNYQNYEKANVIKKNVEKVDFSDVASITLDKNKFDNLTNKEKEILISNIKNYLKEL